MALDHLLEVASMIGYNGTGVTDRGTFIISSLDRQSMIRFSLNSALLLLSTAALLLVYSHGLPSSVPTEPSHDPRGRLSLLRLSTA